MTTPDREEKCFACERNIATGFHVDFALHTCAWKPQLDIQESRDGDSWESDFEKQFSTTEIWAWEVRAFKDAIKDWIRTKRSQWGEEAYMIGYANGGSQEARTLALQEAAESIAGLEKKGCSIRCGQSHEHGADVQEYNQALEDAAREIEKLTIVNP
jgi:hypothetical protein